MTDKSLKHIPRYILVRAAQEKVHDPPYIIVTDNAPVEFVSDFCVVCAWVRVTPEDAKRAMIKKVDKPS